MKKFTKKDIEEEKDNSKNKTTESTAQVKTGTEFVGLFVVLIGIVIFISLYTYSPSDVHIFSENAVGYKNKNAIGLIGSSIAYFLVDLFGIGAYFWSLICAVLGFGYLIKLIKTGYRRFLGALLLVLCIMSLASAWNLNVREIYGGGFCGDFLRTYSILYLSSIGSALLWGLILLYALNLLLGISWFKLTNKLFSGVSKTAKAINDKRVEKAEKKELLAIEEKSSASTSTIFEDFDDDYADNFDDNDDDKKKSTKNSFSLKSLFKRNKNNDDEEILNLKLEDTDTFLDDDFIDDDFIDDDYLNADYVNIDDDFDDTSATEKKSVKEKKDKANKSDKSEAKDKKNKTEWSLFPKKKATDQNKTPDVLTLPPISLLTQMQSKEIKLSQAALTAKGERLIKALADFNVQAKMVRAVPGPVITMYEIQPAPGIRVSKISALADDLAMHLKAVSIRIQAPIPGSDTVGIEVPNEERANVSFRELIEGNTFKNSESMLTMALGKDIKGTPYSADLAKMPHLLIAGATGAGKSVCLNSIIISLLYKAKPDEVKLLLVDPKRIELSIYEDLPHLVHPVVTEMELAKNALLWAIEEMNRRFALLRDLTVRNIADYNAKVKKMSTQEPLPKAMQPNPEETLYHTPIPYLVIIIDELADLIMTHGREVESSIVRLAQLARAAGIHIILATQRPSVDVVTGLIKANFPCRISFQVTQKVDSRTILDAMGAETLLGRGDMLFKPGGGKLLRLHGAFVPDDDVAKVVNYWKKQQKPDYSLDFTIYGDAKQESSFDSSNRSDISSDPIYQEAIKVLGTMEKFSISGLQRRLRIGFNKAALIKEQLEKDGLIQDR